MKSLIITGPSGVGKGSTINRLLNLYPTVFEFVISYTTRSPRPTEVEGRDYFFLTNEQFDSKVSKGEMLEHKNVYTNKYGTSKQSFHQILQKGKIPVMDVDIEGMLDINKNIKNSQTKNPIYALPQIICILPASYPILIERLSSRKTESDKIISLRMQQNKKIIDKFMHISEERNVDNLYFVTNYEYKLTTYGIQLFLNKRFEKFREKYWGKKKLERLQYLL